MIIMPHPIAWLWSPAMLPSLATWYVAEDEDATLVKAMQPGIFDGTFDTGTGWTVTSNWTISGGKATHTGGSEDDLYQTPSAALIVGNVYATSFEVSGYSAGSVQLVLGGSGAGSTHSSDGIKAEDIACAGSTVLYIRPELSSALAVDNLTVANLSRTQWNPSAGSLGGYLSQPTAVNQPYWDGDGLKFEFIGSIVSSLSESAWTFLHDDTDMTVSMAVIMPATLVSGQLLADHTTLATVGINWAISDTGVTYCYFSNGSGTEVAVPISSAGAILAEEKCVLTLTKTSTSTSIRKNGTEIAVDSTIVGLWSSSDPASTLSVGNAIPITGGVSCSILEMVFDKSVDNIYSIESYLIDKYDI